MADYYIDYEETQRYGAEFIRSAKGMAKYDPIFANLVKRVEHSTAAVGAALAKANKNTSAMRKLVVDKRDVLPQARKALSETYYWARANPAVEVRDFFPKGRAKTGRSATAVLVALHVVGAAFGKYRGLPGANERKALADKLASRLRGRIDEAQAIKGGVSETTPELVRARKEWRRVYGAAKLVIAGMLRLEKPKAEVVATMKQVFPDLRVHSPRRAMGRRAAVNAPASRASAASSPTTTAAAGNVATSISIPPPDANI